MNELFAVGPKAFQTAAELRMLLAKFGPYEGRYVAEYPNVWKKLVHEYVDVFPDFEKKRIREILVSDARSKLLSIGSVWEPKAGWSENVSKMQRESPRFAAVIGNCDETGPFPTLSEFDWSGCPDSHGQRVEATADNYAQAARTLLRISPRVVIVDPYFRPQMPKYARTIEAFVNVASSGTPKKLARIDLICRADELKKGGQDLCSLAESARNRFAGLRQRGIEVWLYPMDDEGSPNKMHERFLLSELGAIDFGNGFDDRSQDGQYVHLKVVSREVHKDLCNLFFDGAHGFKIAGPEKGGFRLL